ncbi:Resistance to glucose repression protein 1 [Candida viswanathii]|uniref:Resistance to glucose repression protein 1 n=1 Tax=Candida viswanathii TaxID=5486 RepID=A0A367XX70_9ASCO|nr:Resistance to glucose repression protein 1 [Candida viswanathii]
MYFYDDMILGSSLTTTQFHNNVDYLQYVPQDEKDTHYLNNNLNLISFIKYIQANPEYSIHNQFLCRRLMNICWRRIYKNHHNLAEVNPLTINWDKNSDITWLFGPEIELPEEEPSTSTTTQQAQPQEQPIDLYDNSDNISISSFDSFSSLDSDDFPSSSRRRSTTSTNSSVLLDEDEDIIMKGSHHDLTKSILKKKSSLNNKTKKKKVSFNYIVNTREIINGMSVDYDFLDKDCL